MVLLIALKTKRQMILKTKVIKTFSLSWFIAYFLFIVCLPQLMSIIPFWVRLMLFPLSLLLTFRIQKKEVIIDADSIYIIPFFMKKNQIKAADIREIRICRPLTGSPIFAVVFGEKRYQFDLHRRSDLESISKFTSEYNISLELINLTI